MATVLVADDNRANRHALAALLESAGHNVLVAADGREALEKARAERPALVISDVLMPLMDGYELARRLRDDPGTSGTALLFYTAYFGSEEARQLALAHGVARVMVKPAENAVILRAVEELLVADTDLTPAVENLDREHLRIMVDQLLDKTDALEAQQRRIERLNRTLAVLSAVNALAVDKGGFRLAAVGLLDPASQELKEAAAAGEGSATRELERLKVGTQPLVWNDVGAGAFVALPLIANDEAQGVILLYARSRDFFDEEEMRLLLELAGDVSFALHHLEQKARMDYLAVHDSLTDLPNRSLFTDRMGQVLSAARREKRFAAAVFIDVERFRMVNETFGRKAGDELLRQVAQRLARAARDEDTVARIGADHFAVAVAPFDQPGDTTHRVIEQFERAMAQPFPIDGVELRVSLKAGVAVYPTDGATTELLCANAETALAQAKAGGQKYLFYAPEMNARVAESLAMENRLRRALDDGHLALHYQPKIDVRSGALAGLEALIRWTDPELGAVPPSKFVGVLEATGMILAAGRWALRRAVDDMNQWRAEGLNVPRISVNVSAIQLRQPDFVDSVLQAIGANKGGKPPGGRDDSPPMIDLEITESVLVEDIDESTRKLQTLRRAGVGVSVDDFGTGYCSLSYLARLPVDTLKIDRSFVVRMRDAGYPRNIVAMIVSLAHTLGLKVIAEGVEDDDQLRLLRELGCDQIQGYLVGRPMPAEQVDALLRQARARDASAA